MQLKQWHDSFAGMVTGQNSTLSDVISGTDTFPATMRLEVYRNNYHQGLIGHLRHTFERCNVNVGEDYFAQLAGSYIRACPPRTPDLQTYGQSFPLHIETLSTQRPELSGLPYLPDLAKLDWLCDQVYYSPHRQIWPQQAFQQLPPEQHEYLCLLMSPDCRLLRSHWPLAQIWELHSEQRTEVTMTYLEEPEYLLVHRSQHRIRLEVLDAAIYQLLTAIKEGQLLGQLAEEHPEGMAQLPALISSGWIDGFRVEAPD